MRLVPANPLGWAAVMKGADLGLLDRLSRLPSNLTVLSPTGASGM